MTDQTRLTLKANESVAVRMYGQGFGDCFLLAFPRAGQDGRKRPVYVVVDCGVFAMTPGGPTRMRAVVEDIRAATAARVDLLVVTHEHYDHVSGFEQAKATWQSIAVQQIWLAWTENPADRTAQAVNRERRALRTQVAAALVEVLGTQAAARRLGVDELEAPDRFSPVTDAILEDLATVPERRLGAATSSSVAFLAPGEVHVVPKTAVDAYVLAPPRAAERLAYRPAADPGFGEDLVWQRGFESETPVEAPFPNAMTLTQAQARQDRFFRSTYYEGEPARRIDAAWLSRYNQLALQFERVTNNTSLVLAFRLPDGRVLLFPGDAEAGSWLSWWDLKAEDWHRTNGRKPRHHPEVDELLRRVVLYKVSHHGSDTGTPPNPGLSVLGDDLIALVPSSVHYPQDNRDWTIPSPALMGLLRTATGQRVVCPQPELDAVNIRPDFRDAVQSAADMLGPVVSQGTVLEGPVPLWREVRLRRS